MSEILSLYVQCRHDLPTETMQLQIVSVDTGKEVHLKEGSFLLRISTAQNGSVLRCFIRHIASGREAYIQSGPNVRAFIKACLLQDDESLSEFITSEKSEEVLSEPESRPESDQPGGSGGSANE
jgi:hypothetical protein